MQNKVVENNELKTNIANELPYEQWLKDYKNKNDLDNIYYQSSDWDDRTLFRLQKQFAYTKEDINKYMTDLVINKKIHRSDGI